MIALLTSGYGTVFPPTCYWDLFVQERGRSLTQFTQSPRKVSNSRETSGGRKKQMLEYHAGVGCNVLI